MDQASPRSAMRALNTSREPSGLKAYSSSPPKGLEGTLARMLPDTLTGVPAVRSAPSGAVYRLERVPSFQVSQCRTNSSS